MTQIIDFKSETQADSHPITDDECRLANIYDVVVGLIIDIENATGFYALDNILNMYQYLADTRLNYHMGEAERLEKELKQLKGSRNA